MNDVSELKKREYEPIDLSQFEGIKQPIKKTETLEVPSTFNGRGRQWVLKVSCEPMLLEGREGSPIIPSELFNLTESDGGDPDGWSSQGNLQKFLDRMNCQHPEELADKNVILRVRRKNEHQFLGFVTK